MRHLIIPSTVLVVIGIVGTLVIFFTAHLTLLQSLRIVIGSFFLLVVPGLVWSFVFFPAAKLESSLDWTSRIILALGLSMAIIPLAIFFASKTGMAIATKNIVITASIVIIAGLATLFVQRAVWRKK